jgi:hypothetical protein
MSEHLTRLALLCYPPSFRERYGEEMTALVSDRGTSGHTVSNLLAGAARAWVRPVLAGGPAERGRRRLQATFTTIWVTVIAGFLVAPATDRALLDPAPAYIPTGTVTLFTIGAGAAALACLLSASAGLRLFLHTIRAHDGEQRRRILRPLAPGVALAVVDLVGLGLIMWWRSTYPPLSADPHFPIIFTGVLLLWGVLFAATLIAAGFGPAIALTRAAPPARWLLPGARLAVPIAGLMAVAAATSAIASMMLLSHNNYDWFTQLFTVGSLSIAAGASVVALVTAGRGVRVAFQR